MLVTLGGLCFVRHAIEVTLWCIGFYPWIWDVSGAPTSYLLVHLGVSEESIPILYEGTQLALFLLFYMIREYFFEIVQLGLR